MRVFSGNLFLFYAVMGEKGKRGIKSTDKNLGEFYGIENLIKRFTASHRAGRNDSNIKHKTLLHKHFLCLLIMQ